MPDELVIIVNGKPHTVQVAPDTPLLYVLRNELDLYGPQFGCSQEQCGACTVLVGAEAKQSCRLPVSEVGNARITTLEGLIEEGELHPLQRAWIEEQAVQCGYCINGMIMTSKALLDKNPKPTDAQIKEALAGNLCRCGTYARVRHAIHALAASPVSSAGPKS